MPKWPPSSRASSTSPPRTDAGRPGAAARALTACIRAYQVTLRAALPPACRFAPSCSEYAHEAVRRHGAIHGGTLTLRRLVRCHPWHEGGFDPVPDQEA